MDRNDLASTMLAHELHRLNDAIVAVDEKLDAKTTGLQNQLMIVHADLVALKAKASVWGAVAGFLAGSVTTVVTFFATK